MTDYLPVILPTEEKVAAMLNGTSHGRNEVVGKMAGGAFDPWEYTVEQVAVNAVMAGARPEYLPVILALAASGQASLYSSTNSFAYSVVVNGPIRDQIKMHYRVGATGTVQPGECNDWKGMDFDVEKPGKRRHRRRDIPGVSPGTI